MKHILELSSLLIYVTGCVVLAKDKRVLLHSDQDLYQVISSLQTEIAKLNASLRAETTLTSSLRNDLAALNASLRAETALKSSLRNELASLNTSLSNEVDTLQSALQNEVSSRQAEVATLKSKISTLETNLLHASQQAGSVYVRWGRTSCPGNGTEMVYKGRMAGSKHSEHGGAANHLCLPDDPTWGKFSEGMTGWATIYGTEMELSASVANVLFGKPVKDEDIPCTLCRTIRPSNVMIGGRATCYSGWTMEYQGYIISNYYLYNNNADYVCLDSGVEFAPSGVANNDDHIVGIVEAVCGTSGSLPCPPYVNGRELSCVVCSK